MLNHAPFVHSPAPVTRILQLVLFMAWAFSVRSMLFRGSHQYRKHYGVKSQGITSLVGQSTAYLAGGSRPIDHAGLYAI